ncbi:MAG TPA: CAP domain-containing protein, partial [Tepidiformaceae bacterium]|nr:CAP domain-containing protein [Tepidiformaceae bacterium]
FGILAAVAGTAIGLSMTAFGGGSGQPDATASVPESAGVVTTSAAGQFEMPFEIRLLGLSEMQPDGVYALPTVAVEVPAAAPVAAQPAAAQPAASQPAASQPAASQPVVSQPAPAEPAAPAPEPVAPGLPENFYLPEVGAVGGMSGLESQMFQLMNAERAANGLPAYAYDASLSRVARIRGHQMIDQGYFGHRDPFGFTMYVELLNHFGFGFRYAGENLVMNGYAYDVSASLAVEGLMNSPTHRANMLNAGFTRVGVGEVTDGAGGHYYTLIFLG